MKRSREDRLLIRRQDSGGDPILTDAAEAKLRAAASDSRPVHVSSEPFFFFWECQPAIVATQHGRCSGLGPPAHSARGVGGVCVYRLRCPT